MDTRFYMLPLAAYVRGHALRTGAPSLSPDLLVPPLEELSESQMQALFDKGAEAQLKLYRFKTTHGDLPRVRRVLGFLRGISFDSLLDVGSGRGTFLLPFMDAFPWISVTSLDILDHRVEYLNDIARGGLSGLSAMEANICDCPLPDHSVDVVTLLEVLEHIPDVAAAVRSAVRVARQYVVVSVPSHEDDNEEHIHLLTKPILTELFTAAGASRLNFDGVNGHLILIAQVNAQAPFDH